MELKTGVISTWCEKHWAVVKKEVDEGTMNGFIAVTRLMGVLFADERFMRKCGWNPEYGRNADSSRINEVIVEIGPGCCFVGDEKLAQVYEGARIIRELEKKEGE